MAYEGNSIVDYLSSVGQPTDYASRARLAASQGIQGYTGSAQQNTQLLNNLRVGGGSSTPTSMQPNTTTPQPQTTSYSQPSSSGSNDLVQALVSRGYNQTDAQNAASGPRASELRREYLGGGSSGASATNFLNTPSINLPELYNNLYKSSGVTGIEEELSKKSRTYNEAVAKIKDNPYLSEATITGRLATLQDKFNADTALVRDDIATKKADIETQLNLQAKQFDINSQQAQLALNQFNSLVSSGALNDATGEDIANITRSTGLSSSIIRSAIDANKTANLSIQTQTFDDGVDEGFIVYTIDPQGNVVNQSKQITGKSSKAGTTGVYSEDSVVNSFIQQYVDQSSGSSISDLWKGTY